MNPKLLFNGFTSYLIPPYSKINVDLRKQLLLRNSLVTIFFSASFLVYFMITDDQTGDYLALAALGIGVFTYISTFQYYHKEALHIGMILYLALIIGTQFVITNAFVVICFVGITLTSVLFMFKSSRVKLIYYVITLCIGLYYIFLYFQSHEGTTQIIVINMLLFVAFLTFILFFHNHLTKEQNQYIDQIEKARDFLQYIIDSMPQLIYIKDLSGKYKMVNKTALKFHKKLKEEVIGKHDFDILCDFDLVKEIREQDQKVKDHLEMVNGNLEIRPANQNEKQYFQTQKSPIFDNENRLDSILTVCTDVTERINTLGELKSSKNLYKLLFEHTFQGITIFNIETSEVLETNQKHFPEYNEKNYLKINPLELCARIQPNGKTREERYENMIKKLKLHNTADGECLIENAIGQKKLIEINISLLPSPNEKIAVILSRDITEKKKAIEIEKNLAMKSIEINSLNHEISNYNLFVTNKNSLLKSLRTDLVNVNAIDPGKEIKGHVNTMIKKIDRNLNSNQDWLDFKIQFERIHPEFFRILIENYPNLTENDLKHCAYIKMNLSLNEVSDLMFIDKRSVEIARYRIKKKMNLLKGQKLKELIISIGND